MIDETLLYFLAGLATATTADAVFSYLITKHTEKEIDKIESMLARVMNHLGLRE